MNSKIGFALPKQHSFTIDGNGNRVLASADSNKGGLILFYSVGQKLNITGTNQSGGSYTEPRWWANNETDNRCDYRLSKDSLTRQSNGHYISSTMQYTDVRYHAGVSVAGTNISNENLIFVAQYNKSGAAAIIALDDQYRCRLAITPTSSNQILGLDTGTNSDGDLILAAFGKGGMRKGAYQLTCNITDGLCEQVQGKGKKSSDAYGKLYNGYRIRLSSDTTKIYVSANGHLWGYNTKISGGQRVIDNNRNHFRYCKGNGSSIGYFATWDFSSNSDDVFYTGGYLNSQTKVHRVEWTSNTSCRVTASAGKSSALSNTAAAGNLDADDIRVTDNISGLQVSSGRLIFSHNGYVDELTESSFTAVGKDSAWQIKYGGPQKTRLQGAQEAITAIFTDTTLTSGANFGFGYWNGGGSYYGGWQGNHPAGRSRICNKDACLQVGIGPEGAANAIQYLGNTSVD